jgi:hypothetical protein
MFYFIFFKCLEHVVNLANAAVMGHITKIAVIENTNAIWEYYPELPGNCILEGLWMLLRCFKHLYQGIFINNHTS